MNNANLKDFAICKRKFNLRLGQTLAAVANITAPGLNRLLTQAIKEKKISEKLRGMMDKWPQYDVNFKRTAGQLFIAHGEMLMIDTTGFSKKELESYQATVLRQENIIQGMLVGKNGFVGDK